MEMRHRLFLTALGRAGFAGLSAVASLRYAVSRDFWRSHPSIPQPDIYTKRVGIMGEPPTPIFIFSLPRAGSTLLQRMLAAHDAIASAPEPTFLLPLLYTLKDRDVYAAYSHELVVWAIEDFAATPNGRADYLWPNCAKWRCGCMENRLKKR